MDINNWVDVKQDSNFYRTKVLSNWEYVIMKSLHDSGRVGIKEIESKVSKFIVTPKHYDEELTSDHMKSRLMTALESLKERGMLKSSSDGSWRVTSGEDVGDKRKELVSWYLKLKK
ncbi:hypothetical protein ACFLYT_01435 [Nanoarchaeota archaeon]